MSLNGMASIKLNDKLYLHVSGEFTVCGVGWVRDLVLCLYKGYG